MTSLLNYKKKKFHLFEVNILKEEVYEKFNEC